MMNTKSDEHIDEKLSKHIPFTLCLHYSNLNIYTLIITS